MGGDSIAQARKALYEILDLLRPEDIFNVIRFGSTHEKLFPSPVQADDGNLKRAKNLLEVLDADMGGTEIGQAVAAAIKSKLPESHSKEIAALGVKYQLMTQHTNYLAIDVKADDEKAGDLPALRKTPQMLAAGWVGSGTILREMSTDYMEAPMLSKRLAAAPSEQDAQFSLISIDQPKQRDLDNFIHRLNQLDAGLFTTTHPLSSIKDLVSHGVPEDIAEDLIELSESGIEEHVIVVAFLYLLSQHERFKMIISRSLRRIIIKAYKQLPELQDEVSQKIEVRHGSMLIVRLWRVRKSHGPHAARF